MPWAWRLTGDKMTAGVWAVDALKPHHWDFLQSLPTTCQVGNALLFHGTPQDTRGLVSSQKEAAELAAKHDARWLFGGHTHKAQMYRVGSQQVVGVGSVGLASNGIYGAACYVLLDGDKITFRHVSYDLDSAIAAIKNSELYKLAPTYARESMEWMSRGE